MYICVSLQEHIFCIPCVKKHGLSNARSRYNLNAELCIRKPFVFYTCGSFCFFQKKNSPEHHPNITETPPQLYIYVYIYIYIFTYMYIYIYIKINVYTHIKQKKHVNTWKHIQMEIRIDNSGWCILFKHVLRQQNKNCHIYIYIYIYVQKS